MTAELDRRLSGCPDVFCSRPSDVRHNHRNTIRRAAYEDELHAFRPHRKMTNRGSQDASVIICWPIHQTVDIRNRERKQVLNFIPVIINYMAIASISTRAPLGSAATS